MCSQSVPPIVSLSVPKGVMHSFSFPLHTPFKTLSPCICAWGASLFIVERRVGSWQEKELTDFNKLERHRNRDRNRERNRDTERKQTQRETEREELDYLEMGLEAKQSGLQGLPLIRSKYEPEIPPFLKVRKKEFLSFPLAWSNTPSSQSQWIFFLCLGASCYYSLCQWYLRSSSNSIHSFVSCWLHPILWKS